MGSKLDEYKGVLSADISLWFTTLERAFSLFYGINWTVSNSNTALKINNTRHMVASLLQELLEEEKKIKSEVSNLFELAKELNKHQRKAERIQVFFMKIDLFIEEILANLLVIQQRIDGYKTIASGTDLRKMTGTSPRDVGTKIIYVGQKLKELKRQLLIFLVVYKKISEELEK